MQMANKPLRDYRNSSQLTLEQLGDVLGVNKSTIKRWEDGTVAIPAERILEIERVTGISRHILRPDIFGPPPSTSAAIPSLSADAVASGPVHDAPHQAGPEANLCTVSEGEGR